MIKDFFPHEYVEDIHAINYQKLYDSGYRGLFFDIDNTLVPHGMGPTKEIDTFFQKIHEIGFKTLLLSNNSEERIKSFITNINTLYVYDADKPSCQGFIKALELINLPKEKVIMIGDTTFTDIVGANKVGIPSILVKYKGYYRKEKKGIKRNIEKVILLLYKYSWYTHRIDCE